MAVGGVTTRDLFAQDAAARFKKTPYDDLRAEFG